MILKTPHGVFCDDTKQLDEGMTFVKTAQNIKYFDGKGPSVSSRVLLQKLDLQKMKVAGITGTNGKTTTAAAIYSLLLDLDKGVAMQGTRGFFINEYRISDYTLTTPSILETIAHMYEAAQSGCEYFVMEVSSHAIAQNRIENLPFALKVHTNVTSDHLDYHGSLAQYRAVKQSFFADAAPKLINRDEGFECNTANAQTYGVENPATFKIRAYQLSGGINAVLTHFDKTYTFHSPLRGNFNLYNITAAIAAVKMLTDAPMERIMEEVEHFGGVSGRMEVVSEEPLVIVDFAHTADGIAKVIESFAGSDTVVLFGAGGNRDKSKRPLMAKAAAGAKRVYVTSDNPRDEDPEAIIDDIMPGFYSTEKVRRIADRKEAIETAINELGKGETLLILGKGDESTQEIGGVKHAFDDREIVRTVLKHKMA